MKSAVACGAAVVALALVSCAPAVKDPMDLVNAHPFTAPLVVELESPSSNCNAPPSSALADVKSGQRWDVWVMDVVAQARYQHDALPTRTYAINAFGLPFSDVAPLVYATVWGGEMPISCNGVSIAEAWVLYPMHLDDDELQSTYGIDRDGLQDLMAENADRHGIQPAVETDLLRDACASDTPCDVEDGMLPP